ncbi:MAG: hypothetical protein JEY91_08645 [Spirochaetaceae bacterium]|nr:hypothetical protein [Spirochaetaceae bacterium]
MNLRTFTYYTIDHPLLKNEKIIMSNRNEIARTTSRIYEISKNPQADTIHLIRVHISGEMETNGDESEQIRSYERQFHKKEKLDYYNAKISEIIRFTSSLIIAYILYIAPESFWNPIVSLFNVIAHGLSDYARWCIIAFFPLKALIRSFGSLLYIRGKINIGIKGQWHKIHESSMALDVYNRLDDSISDQLKKEMKQFIRNLSQKGLSQSALIGKIETLMMDIWNRTDLDNLNEQFLEIIDEGEKTLLWGEMVKLNMLRKEILYYLSAGDWTYSTILHFSPRSEYSDKVKIPLTDIQFQSFSAQTDNLKLFNHRSDIQEIKESIFKNYDLLLREKDDKNYITILESISCSFETLRDEARRYHMGDNCFIPHGRKNDIALFYHHLYVIFGKALCDLENKYRRTSFGLCPLMTGASRRRRIALMCRELDVFLWGKSQKRWRNIERNLFTAGGRNLASGLLTSFLILFLSGSILSFYTVNPGDQVIRSSLKIGYRGQFINREFSILESGNFTPLPFSDRELAWHFPRPITRDSIIKDELNELSLYMIMGENHGENLFRKLLSRLSGQLGTRFNVIELKLKYTPLDARKWGLYNSDGKGERRLIRDMSELAEEWRSSKAENLAPVTTVEFEKYFRELSKRGVIGDYLRRSFSQTAFSTNIYYGTLTERFDSGINAVESEFKRKLEESKNDYFLDIPERQLIERNLTDSLAIIKELREHIDNQVTVEYSLLRSDPPLLNQLVEDPFKNFQQLRDFETLWINISSYIYHLYRQDRIMEILSTGYIDLALRNEAEKLYPDHLSLADYLQKNILISQLIKIHSIKFNKKEIGLTEFTQYQQRWQDTI